MKIVGITQARYGSSRLRGKILKEINDQSLLEIHLHRMTQSQMVNEWVVATTREEESALIVAVAEKVGLKHYQGSLDDVLDRYYQAALPLQADIVVRVTSDCPLIDAEIIDGVCRKLIDENLDYVSNSAIPSFADGLDVEAMRFSALDKAWKEAKLKSEREHVTAYISKNSTLFGGNLFKAANYANETDDSDLRITVDHQSDFEVIRGLVEALGSTASWREYINWLRAHKEISSINSIHQRNEGYLKSIQND